VSDPEGPIEPFGTPPPEVRRLRFVDAMPRALFVVFAAGVVAALALATWALLRPPLPPVALEDRRPPPRGPYTHYAGRIAPAPLPSIVPTVPAPCPAVARTRIVGGGDAVVRIGTALQRLCALSGGGVPAELRTAIGGLDGATLRFGGFSRTGVESTADVPARVIYINIKLALHRIPPVNLAPVIVHDAWHLARAPEAVTAQEELGARAAEVQACRQLIDVRAWPRWCRDADRLTAMPRENAIRLLVSAGFAER
jgi:hypothetical protein